MKGELAPEIAKHQTRSNSMATLFAARDVIWMKPLERAVLAAWAGQRWFPTLF